MPGVDVAARAHPCNLGLNLLRFPVDNLPAYADHLERQGIGVEQGTRIQARLEPYGEARMFAVKSPDGAWIEFYQPI